MLPSSTARNFRSPLLIALAGLALSGCGGPAAYREAYHNGQPKALGEIDGRVAQGTWTRFHPDGSLASLGGYVDGRQSGRWLYGHPGGIPAGVGHFEQGIQHGWWQVQDDAGHVLSAGLMARGQRVGAWLERRGGHLESVTYPEVDLESSAVIPGDSASAEALAWRPTTRAATLGTVRWSLRPASGTGAVVEATWSGPGSPFSQILLDPDLQGVLEPVATAGPDTPLPALSAVPAPAPRTIAVPAAADQATPPPPDAAVVATAPSAETVAAAPPPTPSVSSATTAGLPPAQAPVTVPGVALSPIPEQAPITGLYRFFGERFTNGFAAGDKPTPANAPALAATAPVGDPRSQALVGKPLPQTRFLTSNGDVIDLVRPARPTALIIMRGFSNSICLYCSSQTAAVLKLQRDFTDAGIDIAILYPGAADSVPAFLTSAHGLAKDGETGNAFPVPVLLDVNLQLVRALDIEDQLARPTTLIIGTDGKVRWAYVGRSMSDRPSLPQVLAVAMAQR
jgi:hypothetical protein